MYFAPMAPRPLLGCRPLSSANTLAQQRMVLESRLRSLECDTNMLTSRLTSADSQGHLFYKAELEKLQAKAESLEAVLLKETEENARLEAQLR
jgi:hypothetical protein